MTKKAQNSMAFAVYASLLCLMLEAGWPWWLSHLILFGFRFLICFIFYGRDPDICKEKGDWAFALIVSAFVALIGLVDQACIWGLHSLLGTYAAVIWPWVVYGFSLLIDRVENAPLFEKEEGVRIHDESDSLDHPTQTVPAEDAGPDINGGEQEQDP